jgi:ribosome-associated protein
MTDPTIEKITLQDWLKATDQVATGGAAKLAIQAGEVKVNGATETRRGRKLVTGDGVEFDGKQTTVKLPLR